MEYTSIIKDVGNGWYMGQCEQVPGAITQGRTVEEVEENLKEAVALVLASEKEHCQRKIYERRSFIRRKIAVL
jgi:predicted RNase H-like HicB family nuclease